MEKIVPPGSTVGLLGGGQLGRMFAIAARRLGYRVHTFEPAPDSPAGQISDREFTGSYSDERLMDEFVRSVDVITFEFENIPAAVVDRISQFKPVHPRSEVLHICQNREREKRFLKAKGYPHAPFEIIASQGDLDQALAIIGTPSILKTADFGYDGKGQLKIASGENPEFVKFGKGRAILEKWIEFDREVSVVCARNATGQTASFPVSENVHAHHILDYSIVPAQIDAGVQKEAQKIAENIAHDLEVVGLIAVEYFLTAGNRLLVNEVAPRPHNSGHYTFDACVTSQFEQQLRAVCSLPFGSPSLLTPVAMVNLLGDLWTDGQPPDWRPILANPFAKLHLYGKIVGRPGRKMGHYCVLRPNVEEALQEALFIKSILTKNRIDKRKSGAQKYA